MPGLLRGVARTAVIAGTATAVSNRVSRRQAQQLGASRSQQPYARAAAAYAPPPPPPAAAAPGPDRAAQGARRRCTSRAILTDEEFAAEKAKILGS